MTNPYIVGTAVIGDKFYGREALIDKVFASLIASFLANDFALLRGTKQLTSRREHFCLMGNRRIGKTSFLRHLEFLVKREYPNLIGVYWDLQSCRVEEDLTEQLKNGLLDAEEQLNDTGIDYDELEASEYLFVLLELLKRRIIQANKKLLLLVDEAESLIDIGRTDKKFLSKLRLVMQDSTFVRTILCAARHLSEVNQIDIGGPRFLNGFEPVLFVSSLRDVDADALIAQSHTGEGLEVSNEMATEIKEKTNRHPYLIQSICLYLYDHEMNLQKACDYVMQQGMAEKAFADDYRYLAPIEKKILMFIYRTDGTTFEQLQRQVDLDTDTLSRLLVTLQACGYIKRKPPAFAEGKDSSYSLANYFFTRWLQSNEARLREMPSVVSDAAILSFKFE